VTCLSFPRSIHKPALWETKELREGTRWKNPKGSVRLERAWLRFDGFSLECRWFSINMIGSIKHMKGANHSIGTIKAKKP
jgi:hypothetical protein